MIGNGEVYKVPIDSVSNLLKMSSSVVVDEYIVGTVKSVIGDRVKRSEVSVFDRLYEELHMSTDDIEEVLRVLVEVKGFNVDLYSSYKVQSVSDIILLINE